MTSKNKQARTEPRPFVRLSAIDCNGWRDAKVWGETDDPAAPELVKASGRARCRDCGERIEHGEEAVKFYQEIPGSGWTVPSPMFIHRRVCNPRPLEPGEQDPRQ